MTSGTMSVGVETRSDGRYQIDIVRAAWRSTTAGTAYADVTLSGFIDRIITSPSTIAVPTAYDVTLTSLRGGSSLTLDMLNGAAASRSTSAPQIAYPYLADAGSVSYGTVAVDGEYRIKIANAGSEKEGQLAIVLFRQ